MCEACVSMAMVVELGLNRRSWQGHGVRDAPSNSDSKDAMMHTVPLRLPSGTQVSHITS